jgi:hypothetical protein
LVLLFKPLFSQTLSRVVGCCECGGINVVGELASALLILASRCVCSHSCGLASTTLHGKEHCVLRLSAFCFTSNPRPVKHAADGLLIGNAVSPAAPFFWTLQLPSVGCGSAVLRCIVCPACCKRLVTYTFACAVCCLLFILWDQLVALSYYKASNCWQVISQLVNRQQPARCAVLCCVFGCVVVELVTRMVCC